MARFDETVNIQPQNVSTGAAGAMLSLADRLEGFKQQQIARAGQQAVQRGIESAQQVKLETTMVNGQETTVAPQMKEKRFIGGIEIDAHNKALRSAYLASLNNDTREAIANLALDNPDNVKAFNDAANGYVKGVLAGVDPSVRQLATEHIDDTLTNYRMKVQAADIAKQNSQANEELKLSAERSAQAALREARQGNALNAAQSLIESFAIIDSRVEAGFIDPSVAKQQKRLLEMAATTENIRHTMSATLDNGGVLEGLKIVELAQDKPLKGFDVAEQDALVATLKSDLNQFISLQNIEEKQQQDDLESRQDNEFDSLYAGVVTGLVDASDVTNALIQKKISGDQATKLVNIFQTRGQGINDWSLVSEINTLTANSPSAAREAILSNTGTRLTEEMASKLLTNLRQSVTDDSPLKTNRASRFKRFLEGSVKVVGPMGAVDFESQKRLAELTVVYDERVLAGEDPAIVARELVDVDSFLKAPNPKFGSKDDLSGALDRLKENFDTGLIDAATYDREFYLIEDLMRQKSNIESFDKALKEALKDVGQ